MTNLSYICNVKKQIIYIMNLVQIEKLNNELAGKSSFEVLDFFISNYKDKIGFASSFGIEDQILTQMIHHLQKKIKIFSLDTGRLFPETYDLIEKTRSRYKLDILIYFPNDDDVETMVNTKGINLFYHSIETRKLCCEVRKIKPLHRALKGLNVWISGLRKEQSPTRSDMKLVEWDELNGLIKVNPLIEWSEKESWNYIYENNIPYNILHDQGFLSIGCQPCTRAIQEGEKSRAGRWWWENPDTKECGLHKG
jgi:phosphoadenosine phosphosulfate reductase